MATAGLTDEEQKKITEFQDQIINPSMKKLVILDFWAEWCEPCKQLTPILEKTVAEYAPQDVILAKVNVDENKFIASQFQIRSLPTVYALFQGQPVADLTQARTEAQLKQNIDALLKKFLIQNNTKAESIPPEQLAAMISAAEEALQTNDAASAYEIYHQILTVVPDNIDAVSGMIRTLVARGETAQAQSLFDQLDDKQKSAPAIKRAHTAINLAAESKTPDELDELKVLYKLDADNQENGFNAANALFAGGERDEAVEILLNIIAKDRDWNEGAAKVRLLEIFELVGLTEPWTAQNRRKLSAVLFG